MELVSAGKERADLLRVKLKLPKGECTAMDYEEQKQLERIRVQVASDSIFGPQLSSVWVCGDETTRERGLAAVG